MRRSRSLSPVVDQGRAVAWAVGTVGTLAIMAVMAWAFVRATQPEDLTASRAQERLTFLAEVRQAEATATDAYGWVNKEKGLVRLPVERAVELVLKEWQEPAKARADMIARIEAATAPPPEPENPYE